MAWPTDRRPSDALTGELVPEIWSARFIEHTMSYLPCINVVDTEWRSQLAKGDVLHIPVMTTLTASVVDPTMTYAINSTNVQTTFTTTAETLTIDKWYEVPIQIDDSTKKQTQIPALLEKRQKSAAYAIEKTIDSDVNSLFSGLNTSAGVYGSDGQTFTDDILIALMETLDEADVPAENRALVADPSTLADCRKIDKFMSYDYTKNPLGSKSFKGVISAYDVPFYVTNNLTAVSSGTGSYGALLHKEAIGLAIQMPMDIEKDRVASAASDLIYVRCLWGADELRDTFGISFYTRSA